MPSAPSFPREMLRRAFGVFAAPSLFLIVASCSGGGCSSCSSCGTTPLPGGFPKTETSPSSAHIRVTRPGMDFLQDNLPTLAQKALGTSAPGGIASFAIPKSTQSGANICSVATPTPSQCKAEIDLGHSKLRMNAITPNRVKLDGLLPVRIRDLPASFTLGLTFNTYVVAGDASKAPGGDLCTTSIRGSDTFPYKEFPLDVELPLVTETRVPRNGYTKVDVANAVIDIGITQADVSICDDTCGGNCQFLTDAIKSIAFNTLIGGIKDQVKSALGSAFCTAPTPTVTPPCPTGSEPNDKDLTKATQCVFSGTTECVPSLLGLDGRVDLSKALASFSPGTAGGLDFVLASAGDMNPAPGDTALPAWTPRSPPVSAEDNNKNGISLAMLGGALPQPQSTCVTQVLNLRPENIPVPKELLGDVITPWPAGTVGPHIGFALAGRYIDHAAASAYNSGVLCLGVSTEQVDQLNTGYLSILTPSIKLLTFEEGAASAAISTRPGNPPKVKIGSGTDIKKDPLLTITMEKFAVDFYVWSLDRFVRFFTYTADLTIPVNLQTGKDPKTNPTGGLLPVLGDIGLANASVTNADLLMDDPKMVSGGVTGLLGGIVGMFLGGGFKPIDLQSALASAGLAIDIPQGGIRKITSGTDDFLAIFANLSKAASAAHEAADTRAEILEKIIHPNAMGLTATRADFPKLRIRAQGLATHPTEQTWWIDDGTHAAWNTATELTVDSDVMILQGKHVLHVSSRVVGDMASEDDTPVAIPFVIDTLAPAVDVKRDDSGHGSHVTVRARDFVSAESALVARRRVGGENAAWSEWTPLAELAAFDIDAKADVDVDVRDEEGNIGHVSSPLIRGRADSSLAAAGSGCGCHLASDEPDAKRSAWFALGLGALLVTALARRRRLRANCT